MQIYLKDIKKYFLENNLTWLIIFLIIFMFLGAGKVFDHQMNHSSPTGMMASDAFTHNWVAQNTYDTEYINQPSNFAFESNAEFQAKKESYRMFHPPILPILTASLAKFAGVNVYDANNFIIFMFIVIMISLSFFILSKFSKSLALFSLPLCLLFLSRKFFISLSWGWWDFLTAEFFLFAIMLLILLEKFRHRYVLSAILITAAFMAHGIEAIYAAIFILFYLAFYLFYERKEIKNLIFEQVKTLFLVVLIGGYSINIFLKGMGALGYDQIRFLTSNAEFIRQAYGGTPANYFIFFTEFIGFRILIVIGCLVLLYLLIKKKSYLLPYYLFVIFMSFLPYLYIMAGERGYQWRFLWPIYLSFAFGAVVFLIYKLVKMLMQKRIKDAAKITFLKPLFFIMILITFIVMITPLSFNGSGLIDSLDYDSYQWIHQNTGPYAKFWIMFTPLDNQISRLYLLKRHMFISTAESWQSMNAENSLIINLKDNNYLDLCFCDSVDCSLFKESHFLEKMKESNQDYFKNVSVCSFDYIYLNVKNQPELHIKNVQYLNYLINKNISQVVFNNQQVVIAKNIVKGEDCERKFKS